MFGVGDLGCYFVEVAQTTFGMIKAKKQRSRTVGRTERCFMISWNLL